MFLPIILAGGTGTRLWPLSRELYPKQFLKICGSQQTLLQMTLSRLTGLNHGTPLILCNEEHRFLVAEQLRELNHTTATIMLEPCGRNTAPAIALAALFALQTGDDPILLVLPADHIIINNDAFHHVLQKAVVSANQGHLVTFGVVPKKPEIGYGYIKAQKGKHREGVKNIERFIEKPDLETAQSFLEDEDYYWNSGIFMFRASDYLAELQHFRNDVYQACVLASKNLEKNKDFIYIEKDSFLNCPSVSIDYAVMEKTAKAVVIPMDVTWSDIGSWSSLWEISPKDLNGNALIGDVISIDSSDNYIHTEDKLVVTIGLNKMIVVNTKDALLIAAKDSSQKIRQVVEKLISESRSEAKSHREVSRPWGKFDILEKSNRYQVKHITINPGEKLSTQVHHHRAEHWIIVSGTAKVTKDEKTFILTENESTFIPIGMVHTIENPGIIPLKLIEVQSGPYLGEDDIVRFEDNYGRCPSKKN